MSFLPLNSQSQLLPNGVYLYVVTVRGYDGRVINTEVKKRGSSSAKHASNERKRQASEGSSLGAFVFG